MKPDKKKPGPMDIANAIGKMANDAEAKRSMKKNMKPKAPVEPDEDDLEPKNNKFSPKKA